MTVHFAIDSDARRRDAAITAARADRRVLDPLPNDIAPKTDADGYATQAARLERLGAKGPAAFKLGGTNQTGLEMFGVDSPFFGMLAPHELVDADEVIWPEARAPVAEPEIALAVQHDLAPRAEGYSVQELERALAWAAPALEMPDSVLDNPRVAGLPWLLADACAAGRLVLGPRLGASRVQELEDAPCALIFDNVVVSVGFGRDALIGGVLGALREFLLTLARYDMTLPAGAPVTLGGCAIARPVPSAAKIEARFGDVGAAFAAVDLARAAAN